MHLEASRGLPWWLNEEAAYNAGDLGSIPGLGRSPGEGNGNPIQYSCLESQSHEQRRLEGYSPGGHKKRLTHTEASGGYGGAQGMSARGPHLHTLPLPGLPW